MRSRSRADLDRGHRADRQSGAVAAEFAVALPAVILVLVAALAGTGVAALQVRAEDAAADAARILGRGEPAGAVSRHLREQLPGAAWSSSPHDGMVCVRVRVTGAGPAAMFGAVGATSCALDDRPGAAG
ncbi:TadE family type IV pilus minor pilin [Pseudolysinimonas kribbensis]|uniref:TadE family type IV pilus minor pilin n=1 Tax=Pseudolysinimonas kribbensis TaxID=433641 RepID=UPI0031D81A60